MDASAEVPTIQMAAGDGLLDIVSAHLAGGKVGPNTRDDAGYTAMHASVSYGHVDMLRFLLREGGDVNVADEDGAWVVAAALGAVVRGWARWLALGEWRPPLRLARKSISHTHTRNSTRSTPPAGDTPLHVCETPECAQVLLDAGASLTAEDAEGKTPYHIAVEEHRDEMVAFLAAAYTQRGLVLPHVEASAEDEDEEGGGGEGGEEGAAEGEDPVGEPA